MQAGLDLGSVKEPIVFASHDIGEAGQIGEDGTSAILPIQAQQGTLFEVVVCLEVALDGCYCPTQFYPVLPIARISKSSNPLMRMSLQDRGTRSHHFSPF